MSNSELNQQYKKALEIWFNFYAYKTDGMKPKFSAVEGKKLKNIIKSLDHPGTEASQNFRAILVKWDLLDPWLRSNCMDLKVFESKLNVILIKLYNGYSKVQQRLNSYS